MVIAGSAAASAAAHLTGEVPVRSPATVTTTVLLLLFAGAPLLSAAGLYRRRICAVRAAEVTRIGRASLALAGVTALLFGTSGFTPALAASLAGGLTWFALLTLERGLFREWIHARRMSGEYGAPVVVVGGESGATSATARFLEENPVLGFEVRGVASPSRDAVTTEDLHWVEDPASLVEHAGRVGASGVVFDAGSLTGDELTAFVHRLSATGLHVDIASGLRGIEKRRVSVSPLADETFLHVSPLGLTRRQLTAKRLLDVVGSTVALAVLAPVLAMCALLIWAYDRGPVLFRQERVGQDGERFMLFKLRTMVVDAETRRAELEADNRRTGPLFKLDRDPRVTPFGRFLRASSLDEAPQLLNVLEGTMSLVGPRPALPEEVARFDEELNARLSVKPGITGLWQVEARDIPNFDLYRRYDLLYVQNWSIGLDVAVIARTIIVVLMRALRAVVPTRTHAGPRAGLE